MKKSFLLILFSILLYNTRAQVVEPAPSVEQQLEQITESNEDVETEDDYLLQAAVRLQRHPLDINSADEDQLKELRLTPIQIQNLLAYRRVFGKLVNIYELQAVPGWNVQTLQRIKPYITISPAENVFESVGSRFRGGDQSILFRVSRVVEKSKGYLIDSSDATNFYPGAPQKVMLRYKYNYKNLLQFGVVGEKDAGEQFFNGAQKYGFDFYSAHLFIRNAGIIKVLALGDFTVSMGQGLTQWQGLAFKKGPEVMGIKRQSAILRPYNSAGEIEFHRGFGVTLGKNNWEATVFGSYRKMDANFVTDTLDATDDFVSSLQTSGYHRTKSEVEDRHSQPQWAFGGNFGMRFNKLHVGFNTIQYTFEQPLIKPSDPYNLYALHGKHFGNYSIDYSYTFRNLHFFGEVASTNDQYLAFTNGLLVSVSPNVDMSLLYRNISKGYQSLYSDAFTESSSPTNEKGLFAGISIRPLSQWQIDAYTDMFKFPWLRYSVNAPVSGRDYYIQLIYRPNKQLEMYTRYKSETKATNYNPEELTMAPVIYQPLQSWRAQFIYKLDRQVTLRSRVEMIWYDKKEKAKSEGFLLYADVLYRPVMKRYAANVRLQYFETDNYDSRIYAYENDVLYYYSIPVFYDKGYRYYINVNYDVTRRISMWAKWSQTIYPDREEIGSGLDMIEGNHKSEIRLQAIYRF